MTALPLDCQAAYCADFLPVEEAATLLDELLAGYDLTSPPRFGVTPVYMFGDAECLSLDALPAVWGERAVWPDALAAVRDRIAERVGIRFEVARTVYYPDGNAEMGFHTDLPAYGNTDTIASLSLGAERDFALRRIDQPDEQLTIRLAPGSLLFMGPGTQQRYEHALLPETSCSDARLNLTFRRFGRI
jgi:hypothetical protein